MLQQLRPALVILLLLTLLTGLAYPMAVTGVANVLFPDQAQGSLITRDGKIVGSHLLAQSFTSDVYFHARPSATTGPDPKDPTKSVAAPYNAANSGGSNYGPTSKPLLDRMKADSDKLRAENPTTPVPQDLVTTSASGLDPHISPEAAFFQVPRIAKARKLPEADLRSLVTRHIERRTMGLFGEPRVNVLELNLDLDTLAKA